MARYTMSVKGLGKLDKALLTAANKEKVKEIVKLHTTGMQQEAMVNASSTYVKGYSKGDTKKAIGINFSDGGSTGTVGMGMEYNIYTEVGTRFMAAEPLLRPIFNKHKTVFISEIKKVLQ